MLEVRHLTKKYGNHLAVSDVSFKIRPGCICGFLGPNGAGKSTTLNIVTGCLAATAGQVLVGGYDIMENPEAAKRLIGYLPEQPPLYGDMTPREYLSFVAHAKGVSRRSLPDQLTYSMQAAQIEAVADRLIKNLSKGYRQRVGIAQSLLGEPEVIILDEPTVGLDPKQIVEIRDLIQNLSGKHTVIFSSHILSEVHTLCDHVLILSEGTLVASDTPENLESLFLGKPTIELTVKAGKDQVHTILNEIPSITSVECCAIDNDTAKVIVCFDGEADMRENIFFAFSRSGRPILGMAYSQNSLEDVFLTLTHKHDARHNLQSGGSKKRRWLNRRKAEAQQEGAE